MRLLRWLLGLVRRPRPRPRRPRDARGRFAKYVTLEQFNEEVLRSFVPAMRDQYFAPNGMVVRLKARSRLLAVRDARGRFVRFTRIEARTPRRRQQKQK